MFLFFSRLWSNLFRNHPTFLLIITSHIHLTQPVLFEQTQYEATSIRNKHSYSLLHVLVPLPNILGSIGVEEHSTTTTFSTDPLPLVAVAEELTPLSLRLQPDMRSPAILRILLPIATILLTAGNPVHDTTSTLLIRCEYSLVEVLSGVGHPASSLLITLNEFSIIDGSTLEYHLPHPIP